MAEADETKQRLEQLQRDRLRQFTDAKAVYSPRWFMSVSFISTASSFTTHLTYNLAA